ncbi:IS5 family transposase [Nocardia gipuzkoensis]
MLRQLQAIADAGEPIGWLVSVDSTIMRAHSHAAAARRDGDRQAEAPGGHHSEPADHALGRSRGGWGTKLHLACEHRLRPLSLLLTAGQAGDSPQFAAVLDSIRVPRLGRGRARVRPDRVLADKAYSSAANRAYLRERGSPATIPVSADQAGHRRNRGRGGGGPPAFDHEIYRHRTTIERGINRLEQHRAVATRDEKLATRYLAVIQIAAINQWL